MLMKSRGHERQYKRLDALAFVGGSLYRRLVANGCSHLPLPARWRSLTLTTHGDMWLLPLLPPSVSLMPISSSCAPRYLPTWAATGARPDCTPSPTWASSS